MNTKTQGTNHRQKPEKTSKKGAKIQKEATITSES